MNVLRKTYNNFVTQNIKSIFIMASTNHLFKEQIEYLVEHYPHENNTVIAQAMNVIGERIAEARARELMTRASSLEGMEQIRCMEQAFDAIRIGTITSRTVMNYAAKHKLKKDHGLFGRPRRTYPCQESLEENDACVFFSGSYKQEVYEASMSKHRRFIYFNSKDDINIESISRAITKYNTSDGRATGKTVRMTSYVDRCLIVLKMTEEVPCSPQSAYKHPPSSVALRPFPA